MVSVASLRLRSLRHIPATRPSTRKVGQEPQVPFLVDDLAVVIGNHACAVGMREQQVVEVWQEADRGWSIHRRAGRIGRSKYSLPRSP